jgi:hypothetical protein
MTVSFAALLWIQSNSATNAVRKCSFWKCENAKLELSHFRLEYRGLVGVRLLLRRTLIERNLKDFGSWLFDVHPTCLATVTSEDFALALFRSIPIPFSMTIICHGGLSE